MTRWIAVLLLAAVLTPAVASPAAAWYPSPRPYVHHRYDHSRRGWTVCPPQRSFGWWWAPRSRWFGWGDRGWHRGHDRWQRGERRERRPENRRYYGGRDWR